MTRFGFSFAMIMGLSVSATPAHAAELDLQVEGLEPGGRLMLAVVDHVDGWNGKVEALLSINAKVNAGTMRFRLPVPEGQIAVRLFHDENGNGKLDTNMLGIPREGYGFSKNPRVMGPASFEDAALLVNGASIRTTIKIQ